MVHARVGGMPRQFWVLWTGTLINRLGSYVEPFLVLYLTQSRGLAATTAGGVATAYGAGAVGSQILGGELTDRIGRRRTMIIGLLTTAASVLLLAAVHDVTAIVAAAALTGLVSDIYRPASSAMVADLIPPEDRPRAYSLLFWAINAGFAAAASLAGLLARIGYGLLFVLDAATTALYALVIARGTRETAPPRATTAATSTRVGYLVAVRDRLLLAVVGLMLIYAAVYFQAYVTLPLSMAHDGLGAAAYGGAIAVNGIGIAVIQPIVVGWMGRRRPVVLLAGAMLVVGLGFGLTALAASPPAYAATVLAWTIGEIGVGGVGAALVSEIAPPHLRGRYLGLFGTAFGIGGVIAPITGTLVFSHLGERVLWGGCAVAGAVMAVGFLSLAPAVARRTAVAAAVSPGA